MKKVLVLGVLFALPIFVYVFFASAVNNFARLSTLTKDVSGLEDFKAMNGENLQLDDKITILSIFGKNTNGMKVSAFNLNEKIYKKNHGFKDFQFVVLVENGTQDQAQELLDQLSPTTDTEGWNFGFGSPAAIQSFFDSLNTDFQLDEKTSTPYVFIIDKDKNLRGRAKSDKSVSETLYGYDTRSVAELSNVMVDDVDVILAEYRLALKKYNKNKAKK